MRRLWIALALLILVLSGALCHTHRLGTLTAQMADLLTQAETLGESGAWAEALDLTQQAESLWKRHDFYFHVTLHHADTDGITSSFQEVKAFLRCREGGEYSAANAVLIGRINLLYEQEQCSLKNLL